MVAIAGGEWPAATSALEQALSGFDALNARAESAVTRKLLSRGAVGLS